MIPPTLTRSSSCPAELQCISDDQGMSSTDNMTEQGQTPIQLGASVVVAQNTLQSTHLRSSIQRVFSCHELPAVRECVKDLFLATPPLSSVENVNLSNEIRDKIDNLFRIVNGRLGIMPEMAQLKLKLEQPVLDLSREQLVMNKALEYAASIALDTALAQRFIQTQMDIAKTLQEQEQSPSPLTTEQATQRKQELRDALVTLTPKMLDALKEIQADLEQAAFRTAVETRLNNQMQGVPLGNKTLGEAVFQSLYP